LASSGALVQGWQLVGLANGPIFGAATAIQGRLVAKFERRKKRCRDEVNKKYYDPVANIRAIRGTHLTVNEVSLTNPYAVLQQYYSTRRVADETGESKKQHTSFSEHLLFIGEGVSGV